MLVHPAGAEFISLSKTVNHVGTLRHTEWILVPGERIYVLGSAATDPEMHDQLVVTYEDQETPFLISTLSEQELMQKNAASGFLHLNLGIVAAMIAGMCIAGMQVSFGPMLYVTTAALPCSYLFVVLICLYYNDSVERYNTRIQHVPEVFIAWLLRFKRATHLAGGTERRQPVSAEMGVRRL